MKLVSEDNESPVDTAAESERGVLSACENQGHNKSSQHVYNNLHSICNEDNGGVKQSCK